MRRTAAGGRTTLDDPRPLASLDPDVELARRVDQWCRTFELDWRNGKNPRIEERLGDVAEPVRMSLLVELVALDRELHASVAKVALAPTTSAASGVRAADCAGLRRIEARRGFAGLTAARKS